MQLTWLPGVLRSAGVKVVETDGWLSRSHGQLTDPAAVVWHHDASPPGDSPGALGWMLSNWDEASAQCWVDRYGTWHLVGCGVAWHAGSVLPGMPNNFTSLGIETDHTTGEDWPDALIESLRAGTAAILKYQRLDTSSLHFHKTICSPPGRKQDPDGLDLGSERATVGRLMMPPNPGPSTTPPKPTTPSEDDMPLNDSDFDKIRSLIREELGNDNAGDDRVLNPKTGARNTIGQRLVSFGTLLREFKADIDGRLDKIERKVGK